MYLVEKNISVPEDAGRGRGGGLKYPFSKMEVGDCFTIPAGDPGFYMETYGSKRKPSRRHTAQVSSKQYGKRHDMKFVTRMLDDGSCRIWRVA